MRVHCVVERSSLKIKRSAYEDKLIHKGQFECVCIYLPLYGPSMYLRVGPASVLAFSIRQFTLAFNNCKLNTLDYWIAQFLSIATSVLANKYKNMSLFPQESINRTID